MTTPSNPPEQPSAWAWPIVLVAAVLAVLLRVAPVAPNLTLVGALALFAGARVRGRWAYLVPLAVMAVSDVLLWWMYGYPAFNPAVYGAFLLYVALGQGVVANRGWAWVFGGALAGAVLFFLVTNLFAWVGASVDPSALPQGQAFYQDTQNGKYPHAPLLYARSLDGLLACYGLALPFFRTTLAGDLAFSAVLFGAQALLARSAAAGRLAREERP